MSLPSRDAADLPQASEWPQQSCDSPEDRILDVVARTAVKLPAGVSRQWFDHCVAQIAVAALREAAEQGSLSELFGSAEPTAGDLEMVTRILAELMDADNPRLQAKCMVFVLGLNLSGGKSETAIAREEGVGKAAVSKRCIRIREAFGLPPSRGMKKDSARLSYKLRQMGKRARPLRIDWPWKGLLSEALAA